MPIPRLRQSPKPLNPPAPAKAIVFAEILFLVGAESVCAKAAADSIDAVWALWISCMRVDLIIRSLTLAMHCGKDCYLIDPALIDQALTDQALIDTAGDVL